MKTFLTNTAKRFAKDESGSTAIEYSLIAGLIAVLLIPSLGLVKGGIVTTLGKVSAALQ